MNTTFEKEDEDEVDENVPLAPLPLLMIDGEEEGAAAVAGPSTSETEEKFHTPVEDKPIESLGGNTIEEALKVISALFQDVSEF